QVYPKTLFRPVCGVCGNALHLGQSGKYATFCCGNGKNGKHGCTFKGYKTARHIDDAILGFLKDSVVTEVVFERLLKQANEALAAEAAKPKADLAPLRAEIKTLTAKKNRLVNLLEGENSGDLVSLRERLRKH